MRLKTLTFFSIITLLISCYIKPEEPTGIPVTKTVQFKIRKVNDYIAPVFNGLKVKLKLSLANESTLDGKVLAAWDTTFSLKSSHESTVIILPLIITKQFNSIWQSNQALPVS